MGDASKKMMAAKAPPDPTGRRSDLPKRDHDTPAEKNALRNMQREAKAAGSFLSSGGKGGLPPSLVLGVMRRDEYRCQDCGELGDEDSNGGIGVHHIGGIADTKQHSAMGHKNVPENLETICASCHDEDHEEAREEGVDSSQVTPKGDRGNPRRDKGKPPSPVDR